MDDQPAGDHETVVERFHPTNGRFSGFVGLGCAAVILALSIAGRDTGRALGVGILALLGAVLVWAALLRPALWATEHHLVMRGMFRTNRLPLSAIGRVVVTQVVAVTVNRKRYVSPVVGYTARQSIRAKSGGRRAPAKVPTAVDSYQVFVEERIGQLAREHRERFGDQDSTVRRTLAWPEITGVVLLIAAYVGWLVG